MPSFSGSLNIMIRNDRSSTRQSAPSFDQVEFKSPDRSK